MNRIIFFCYLMFIPDRSPIYTHLAATLHGLPVLRAFGIGPQMVQEFDGYQDKHSSAWFLWISSRRWFIFAMDGLLALFLACCVMTSFALPTTNGKISDYDSVHFPLPYLI